LVGLGQGAGTELPDFTEQYRSLFTHLAKRTNMHIIGGTHVIRKGNLQDPVITFMLRCGRTPVKVVKNYIEDEESCHYGALMEWRNSSYSHLDFEYTFHV
jgi:hypothetical protein